jgi:hypothetical protein
MTLSLIAFYTKITFYVPVLIYLEWCSRNIKADDSWAVGWAWGEVGEG